YKPENYYKRVLDVIARHDRANHPNLHASNYPMIKVIFLTLMTIIALGVKAEYRQHFWAYFATVVKKYPKRYVQALINAVIGHHFIRYTKEVLVRQRDLLPIAQAPSPVVADALVAAKQ